MRTQAIFALAGAFLSLVSAVPMKRDVEIDTVTEVDTVVEVVTSTVWVDPTDSPAAPASTSVAPSTSAAPPASSSAVAQPNPAAAYQVPEHSAHQEHTSQAPAPAPTSTWAPPPAPTTTSSAYVAPPPPVTSSSVYVAPPAPETPTTAPVPTTTAAPAPAATSAAPSGGSSSSGQKFTGADLTFYDPSVGYGSCGSIEPNSANIVAVAAGMMDKATMCGKTITVSYKGRTTQARITDTCPGCSGTSLDLSNGTWSAIAWDVDGRAHGAEWWYS